MQKAYHLPEAPPPPKLPPPPENPPPPKPPLKLLLLEKLEPELLILLPKVEVGILTVPVEEEPLRFDLTDLVMAKVRIAKYRLKKIMATTRD